MPPNCHETELASAGDLGVTVAEPELLGLELPAEVAVAASLGENAAEVAFAVVW